MRELARAAAENPAFREAVGAFESDAAVDWWIRKHFLYTPEPFEIVIHPIRAVEEIQTYGFFQGDCDDVATLYAAIFQARGTPVQFEALQTDAKQAGFQHVYTRNLITGQIFDPTVREGTVYRFMQIMFQPV